MKARLFARLREHFQRRDRLRLVIGYRRKYLESLVRQGEAEVGKIAQDYRQASAPHEQDVTTMAYSPDGSVLATGSRDQAARLFARLREHFQRRDRLRLVIGYRRKHLESLARKRPGRSRRNTGRRARSRSRNMRRRRRRWRRRRNSPPRKPPR